MNRLDHDISYKWHVALNDANFSRATFRHWMYEAKSLADEVPRLIRLFALEREGKLPKLHRQCSHSPVEEVIDNHLTCCLGVACRTCEHLSALDKAELTPEQIDIAKAWTCASHILHEQGRTGDHIDTSEGFVKTTDDIMYWERVYTSLAGADDGE